MSQYNTDKSLFTFNKPETWNYMPLFEKISYYKNTLHEHYAPYVDKLIAKRIVKDLCGDKIHVANVVRVLSGPDDISESDLNTDHIIKAVHGSGWNINIKDSTTIEECKNKLHKWNVIYTGDSTGEPQYKYIKPGFFIEEKVNDKNTGKTGEADVYMFRCVRGEPITIGVKRGDIQNSYTIKWEQFGKKMLEIERPAEIDKMIELARILSEPFEFVRIDFYLSADSEIYFSEFTFSPAGGNPVYSMNIEKHLGSLWK